MAKKAKETPKTDAPKDLGGRPQAELDWKQIQAYCQRHCTHEEIAYFAECCIDTLDAACKRDNGIGFSEYHKKHSAGGKRSLRRMLFDAAEKGNVTAQIWLSKNLLGYSDKQEIKSEIMIVGAQPYEEVCNDIEQVVSDRLQ